MRLLFLNIMIAIFNGWVCGFNSAMLATGNSSYPALSGALVALNGTAAILIGKFTIDRVLTLCESGEITKEQPR